jgi:hypothetical protein
MCVSVFSTTFIWNISHSKKKSTRYDQKCILVFLCPVLLTDINANCILSTDFREIFKYKISWKSIQWKPSCSMRKDGQTDRHDEANSRFRNFAKASKTVTVQASTRLGNLKGTQTFMVFHLRGFGITVLVFHIKPINKLSVRCGQSGEYEISSGRRKCQSKGNILLVWPGLLSSIVDTSYK